jgi:type I restriction enzyme R subunit
VLFRSLFFNILDYTGSATRLFADPEFDGDPEAEIETNIDQPEPPETEPPEGEPPEEQPPLPPDSRDEPRRKFYYDGGQVSIAAHLVYELDANGRQLRVVQFTHYTAEQVRTLYTSAADLRDAWADPEDRAAVIEKLAERGIDFDELAESANQPDADPFDLLCHIAFNAPLRTRRERARRLQSERKDFWDQYSTEARAILDELLEKYAAYGTAQFVMPDVLAVPPISEHGNVMEIAEKFGGEEKLTDAVNRLQTLLYQA